MIFLAHRTTIGVWSCWETVITHTFWSGDEEVDFVLNYSECTKELSEASREKYRQACDEAFGRDWTAGIKKGSIMQDAARTNVTVRPHKLELGRIAKKYQQPTGAVHLGRNTYVHFPDFSKEERLTKSEKGQRIWEGRDNYILMVYRSAVNLLSKLDGDERNALLEKLGWSGIASGVGGMVSRAVPTGSSAVSWQRGAGTRDGQIPLDRIRSYQISKRSRRT
ncbi:uncharacterized protein LOC116215006 [Punica granatum]|uniref:Uncharacterized protein LOC116214241 n=1 Tax=Punica granatum TaxID=22663 RepID=A0A6P8E689_PUNGR|nr:uncharacterized protein LOC116214241 [Punica granatum]XP_031406419.1 uncharacterized protein LOC116215006 [Punica granatum]